MKRVQLYFATTYHRYHFGVEKSSVKLRIGDTILAWNLRASCLNHMSAGIIDICHHIQLNYCSYNHKVTLKS